MDKEWVKYWRDCLTWLGAGLWFLIGYAGGSLWLGVPLLLLGVWLTLRLAWLLGARAHE